MSAVASSAAVSERRQTGQCTCGLVEARVGHGDTGKTPCLLGRRRHTQTRLSQRRLKTIPVPIQAQQFKELFSFCVRLALKIAVLCGLPASSRGIMPNLVMRSHALWAFTREYSIVIERRPSARATVLVVPEPQKGSRTKSPGFE